MKFSTIVLALPAVSAFPAAFEAWANQATGVSEANDIEARGDVPQTRKPKFLSNRQNTGVVAPLTFNAADQYVDVSKGSGHEFKAPGPNDLRGQCPGLNAAANHGFIPHNGILSIEQTRSGLKKAYNMGDDLSLFLAVVAVGIGGDPVKRTWSIGAGYPAAIPGIGQPVGILASHNVYESDASIVRGDAYLNGGSPGVFQMRSWESFYARNTQYTLNDAAAASDYQTRWSKANNPYFFQAPFAGLVSPAAYDFVINFMSNRSAESHGGVLTRSTLKTFFAVTGNKPGEFVNHRGMEHIPANWYKRPSTNMYNIPEVLADVFVNNAMYPGIVGFGGNTGKVNSYVGVDTGDFTGGAFNAGDLTAGNAAACFLLQASQQGLPTALNPALGAIGSIAGWVAGELGPLSSKFGCPQLATFDNSVFDKFPGAKYKATGQTKPFLGGLLGKMFRS